MLSAALACARANEPSATPDSRAAPDSSAANTHSTPVSDAALEAWLRSGQQRSTPHGAVAAPRDGSAELAELAELVAGRRGLALRERPELEPVERSELVARALASIEAQTPPARAQAEAALLVALELVPADFSWTTALGALLGEQLEAFYDPRTRRIVVDRALPAAARRRVLAHELVHALVDREHSLGARLAAASSADRQAALLTLAEGDAEMLVAGLGLVDAERSGTEHAESSVLPAVIQRSLAATYVDGRNVVQRLVERGGFAAVDALYRAPPDGTHPLLAPSAPEPMPRSVPLLPVATPPEPGWTLLHADVLGAQTWRTLLESWLTPERAATLAQGWDGDRLVWFERGPERVLVWEIRSRAEHAAEVAEVVMRALRSSPSSSEARTPSATRFSCRARRDGGVTGRWAHGHSLFIAALSSAAQTVQCEALRPWTIPATTRRSRRRDLGTPSLIGPA